jgi:hypothetical protein
LRYEREREREREREKKQRKGSNQEKRFIMVVTELMMVHFL